MKRLVDANRARLAQHLRGSGLEIGALLNPMPIPSAESVVYSDALSSEQLDRLYPGSRHPDIQSDSESFPDIEDQHFDFVVANHVIEHLTDPIRALSEWHRILRPNGLLYLAVPDKRYTFDYSRDRTTLDHLVEDHQSEAPAHVRNECHLREWAEHVEKLEPGSVESNEWISRAKASNYSVHNHVWVAQDILELIRLVGRDYASPFALFRWTNTSVLGNEFVLLLEKKSHPLPRLDSARLRNAIFRARLTHPVHEVLSRLKRVAKKLLGTSMSS